FAEVRDTQKNKNAAILHHVEVAEGSLSVKDKVEAEVDIMTRRDTMKNHSATHLLNKALREVLGEHINQAGSYVDSKRLRFDLTHFEGISKEDLKRIEEIVNEQIALGLPVAVREMSLVESQEEGAIGLFEDKYKDVVRVVNMGNGYSVELCGGTHVRTTSDIQMLKIMSESSVASGIRRIEAITGREVYKHMTSSDRVLSNVGTLLKAAPEELDRRIAELQSENKGLQKEVHNLKQEESAKSLNDVLDQAAELSNGSKVVAFQFEDMDMDTIRGLGDKIRDQIASGVIVLSTVKEGKLNFIAMVTKDLIEKGVFAGNIVKQVAQITGGNGGGRKDFAAAGGKDISKVDEALGQVKTIVEQML
ncbi:MAG: alanine--tRNA ligase, partial [Gallicola sp.]|nr:alanine--tRNA ligase [Gallicola sp.]